MTQESQHHYNWLQEFSEYLNKSPEEIPEKVRLEIVNTCKSILKQNSESDLAKTTLERMVSKPEETAATLDEREVFFAALEEVLQSCWARHLQDMEQSPNAIDWFYTAAVQSQYFDEESQLVYLTCILTACHEVTHPMKETLQKWFEEHISEKFIDNTNTMRTRLVMTIQLAARGKLSTKNQIEMLALARDYLESDSHDPITSTFAREIITQYSEDPMEVIEAIEKTGNRRLQVGSMISALNNVPLPAVLLIAEMLIDDSATENVPPKILETAKLKCIERLSSPPEDYDLNDDSPDEDEDEELERDESAYDTHDQERERFRITAEWENGESIDIPELRRVPKGIQIIYLIHRLRGQMEQLPDCESSRADADAAIALFYEEWSFYSIARKHLLRAINIVETIKTPTAGNIKFIADCKELLNEWNNEL